MIIINQSFIQLLVLVLLTIRTHNDNFYIVYTDKPLPIFKFVLSCLNFITRNKYHLKNIGFFRSQFYGINDQDSTNEMNKNLDNLFNNSLRTGGQIFIENNIMKMLWKSVVIDKIFKYYFYLENIDIEEYQYFIFKFIYKVRKNERNYLIRFTILKASVKYFLFYIKNIFKEKIKSIFKEPEISKLFNFSSLILHRFKKNNKFQNQDFIFNAINLVAKDYKVKKIINYNTFINLLILNISLNIKIINFFQLIYYLFILITKFFISFNFAKDAKLLIDKFIYLCLQNQKIKRRQLRIFSIDPVDNNIIPIFYFLKDKGYKICLLSFSLGARYTKGFSNYNGPYSYILSSNKGFEELAKRSLFSGPIKNSKCYLSLANLKHKGTNNSLDNKDPLIKIIVVEGVADWYREISIFEEMFFASILYQLDSRYKNINIIIKKKKQLSYIENYLASEFPKNKIQFADSIRGYMGDFEKRDYILSHGLSSLAIKSSELFNKPYIIFDKSDNSKHIWKTLYGKSKVKPIFANSENSIKDILLRSNR